MQLARRHKPICGGHRRAPVRLARTAATAVPVAALLAAALTSPPTSATFALYSEAAPPVSTTFRSLSVDDALELHPAYIDLGDLVTSQPVDSGPQLVIQNNSERTLILSSRLKGVPGLHLKVEPETLAPGESAELTIFGRPGKPGQVSGLVRITALDGYLHLEIPVTGRVHTPAEDGCALYQSRFSPRDKKQPPSQCEELQDRFGPDPSLEEDLPASQAEDAADHSTQGEPEPVETAADPSPDSVSDAFMPPHADAVPIVEHFLSADEPVPIVEDFGQHGSPTPVEQFPTSDADETEQLTADESASAPPSE